MWEYKGRKDGRGEWGGPDFMTVEGPGFSLSGPGSINILEDNDTDGFNAA